MSDRHVLVAGAGGLVGAAAVRHFAGRPGCTVTSVSRRPPPSGSGARHVAVDLGDEVRTASAVAQLTDVTHLVYAAVQEDADLLAGWRGTGHIERNARMLRNLLGPLQVAADGLRHVTLLQGPKAYGVHVGAMPIPAREGVSERRDIPNFYWLQEDYLREQQRGKPWTWTIFRPGLVIGQAVGGSMNLVAALGVYAALAQADGEPLRFPGLPGLIKQPTDVDLMARAFDWAQTAPEAGNEVFNIANGEVFTFDSVWPSIAAILGLEPGDPRRACLAELLPARADTWDRVRREHGLAAPSLPHFLRQSAHFADFTLGGQHGTSPRPAIMSTVKLREAGFHDVLGVGDMFAKWFARYRAANLLPSCE
ncbi:MAG TPA: NAD-dependent epimerase/dehydratase family protein [Kutzneria sp.]|jgi:nucleoside-diphosphate-sugar epimerase